MFRIFSMLFILLSLTATVAVSGCHTMSGAGQEIEQGGKAISNEADKHTD